MLQAITHKSFNSKKNYEKLEFLGDRVLGLIISKKLLELYPNEKVGILDKKFSNLVNKNTCCLVGMKLKLNDFQVLYICLNLENHNLFYMTLNIFFHWEAFLQMF